MISTQLLQQLMGLRYNQRQVKIRHHAKDLESDIALKLRVANGTHTAVAHTMALSSLVNTEALCSSTCTSALIMHYLDALYQTQILPAAIHDDISSEETDATWEDWRQRLQHPHFGLSTFFITQNGAAKGGIRLGPTIKSLIDRAAEEDDNPLSVSIALAIAAILRFLTPHTSTRSGAEKQSGKYVGWLDGECNNINMSDASDDIVSYADGLRYNLSAGWYEFRCTCCVHWRISHSVEREMPLPEALAKLGRSRQPCIYEDVVRSYLFNPQGGDLQSALEGGDLDEELTRAKVVNSFVSAVSTLYARMVSGDRVTDLLREMMDKQHVYTEGLATSCEVLVDGEEQDVAQPLHHRLCPIPDFSNLMTASRGLSRDEIKSVVYSEVQGQQAIDLHTHLLPPSHGALCLWGIDELLTYHYLVAEFFMSASTISPEEFYAMNKMQQADLIWNALFIERSPISEAARGVLTTLVALGLKSHVKDRDLTAIRRFYDGFRNDGLAGAERFVDMTYKVSGVRHAIMTNIPFDSTEAMHWRPKKKVSRKSL